MGFSLIFFIHLFMHSFIPYTNFNRAYNFFNVIQLLKMIRGGEERESKYKEDMEIEVLRYDQE